MGEIVKRMRSELRGILRDSVLDYPSKPREKWLFDYPSQVRWRGAGKAGWGEEGV